MRTTLYSRGASARSRAATLPCAVALPLVATLALFAPGPLFPTDVLAVTPLPAADGSAPTATDLELLRSYLPKDDLGVTRFLEQHPEADGRGVIVAILDTGVDLHHPGLLRTPDGERKILDVFDATDNGLVELPQEVATTDSVLWGHTGRPLRLGAHRATEGRYRLGKVSARETLPPGLVRRLLDERAEARRLEADAWETRIAGQADSATGERSGEDADLHREGGEDGDEPLTEDDRRDGAYRKLRRAAYRQWEDPGPAYDVVALRIDGHWRLLIDTDEDGDLGEETLLAPFRENGDLALYPSKVNLSVALSWISEDGRRASLVFDEGGHGTHVAGIIGAWYGPDDPLNGLAPGVRFLAIKIGNGRFGGSTSHNSIPKGITWAVKQGAMAANISFGGTSHFNDSREVHARYLDETVQNHGLFITASAGNEGPGLSTIGAPATARRIFTIGAALSPEKMMTSYGGLPERLARAGLTPGPRDGTAADRRAGAATPSGATAIRMFDFSSRGPLANGSPGVDFISPGAAVSTLPTWHLTRHENWHGTSMAAPQACGALALLISAAMQEGVPVSPPRIDRALRATARPIAGVPFVEQGAGLISLPEAFDALRRLGRGCPVPLPAAVERADAAARFDSASVPLAGIPATRDPICFWRLAIENAGGTGEGLYQRDECRTDPYWVQWWIAPDLPEKAGQPLRAAFNRVVRLRSESPWLEAPPQITIPASGASIRVMVDPSRMSPGLNGGRIAVQTVAITLPDGRTVTGSDLPGDETALTAVVIRPEETGPPLWRLTRSIDLAAGARQAVFVRVPEGATRATLRLKETLAEPANGYDLALTALSHLHAPPALRGGTGFTLERGAEVVRHHRVEGGTVVEIAFFASWVNAGPGRIECEIDFDGIEGPALAGADVSFHGGQSREARWGEVPLVVPPGRDGVVLPLRSRLRDAGVRVTASFHGRVEPLEIEWNVRPDTLHPQALEGGLDPLLLRGEAWIALHRGEAVLCDPRVEAAFEDFLDDAFFRLYTPAGRIVARGTLSSGPFRIDAPKDGPPSGYYRLEFTVFSIGRDLVRDDRLFSPELIREGEFGRVAAFGDPVLARAGADSSGYLFLPRGAARPAFLRVRGLPDDGIYTGTAEVGEWLRVPLRADTHDPLADASRQVENAIETLERESRRLLSTPPGAPAGQVRAAIASLDQADALEQADGGVRDDGEEGGRQGARDDHRRGRRDTRPEEIGDAAWNRRLTRVDLALRHGLADEASDWLDRARQDGPKETESAGDRERAGALVQREAALALVRGDDRAARKALDRARELGLDEEEFSATEAELLRREGKPVDALSPLHRARRADPWNPRLARLEIDLYRELGWHDLARERIDAWREAAPDAWTEIVAVARLSGEPKAGSQTPGR